jgi:acyl-coenzyme A synthetase/AMP-(fatty) acid ligase
MFRHGVNSTTLSSATLKKLVQSLDRSEPPHHDCELFVTSGFLSTTLAEEVISRVTKRLGLTYATSELGTPLLLSRVEATRDMQWLAPDDGRTIEIVDENGNVCREGELRLLLTEVDCTSYLDDDEASAKVFRNGYFYPGDMAVRRPDGRICILGRVDDVVNVQGKKRVLRTERRRQ